MDNPLFNLYVLEIVFNNCKIPTLLNCRSVCQIWNEEVVRALERQQLTAFLKGQEDISRFLECNKSSENHPYSRFWIELPPEEKSEQLYELLDELKHRLKYIKFEYEPQASGAENSDENGDTEQQTTETTIISKMMPVIFLPELESLHLFTTNLYPPESANGFHRLPNLFDALIVPKLTSLNVQHLYDTECAETVKRLVRSSQKILTYLKFPCNELPKISRDVNLFNLQELDVCDLFHSSCATNQTIQCIIGSCPNLQKLSIELGCRVSFEWTFKLFQTLCHCLRGLKLIVQDRNLLSRTIQRVNFHFPNMPKLTNLFLRYTNPGLVYYIDGIPQLRTLELETPWTRKVRGNIFPGIENKSYNQLKSLKLSEILSVNDIQKLNKVFPCLTTFCASFENDEALQEVCKNFTNLECLIVDRKSSVTDSGICGISIEDLQNLDDNFSIIEENLITLYQDKYMPLKKFPDIGNLQRLKILKLVQIDLSWKSLMFGVATIRNLESLSVQAPALRIYDANVSENDFLLQTLSKCLPKLNSLKLWIRRNAERLSEQELVYLNSFYPQWEINVVNQTQCSSP